MRLMIAVVCIVAAGALSGCRSAEKAGAIERDALFRVRVPEEEVANHIEPEMEGPPLLEVPVVPPPTYELKRVPVRPHVIGRLDVPLKRKWKYIVIHHSDTDNGNRASFDRNHREKRGWLGVGYDFVIGNGHGSGDGAIEVTFRWEQQIQGAHAGVKEYNEHGIGICLVGNFERDYPTQKQMESLVSLVSYLQEKCHIPAANILMHRNVKNTRCPGRNFPYFKFISLLAH